MQIYGIRKMLGIPEYKISKIISITDHDIHIEIEPYKRKKAECSFCDEIHKKGYHDKIITVAKDLDLGTRKVHLHVIKRRYECSKDNKVHIEKVPWLKMYGRVTQRYAQHVNRLTAITTNQEAGWFLGVDDQAVYRIDKGMLEEQAREKLNPLPAAKNMSVDEVSYRKYHKYLTNVIDVDKRKVIWNAKGRTKEVMDTYYEKIGTSNCEAIESIALDGARAYISSAERHAINARIVYDKFHIFAKLNKAVDDVRKSELKNARRNDDNELVDLINCKQRFILLKTRNRLTEKQSGYLEKLCSINKPIYEAMLLKESFLRVYSCRTEEEARIYLNNWISEAFKSTLAHFHKIAKSFLNKFKYIINWFKIKISSAISEGFNNKIKRLKRMAYGYKDVAYFLLKIHQHCGLLNPRLTTI